MNKRAAVTKPRLEIWEKSGRMHVRGITADYGAAQELERLRSLPRVIKSADRPWEGGPRMFNKMILEPNFGAHQSIFVHMKEFLPGTVSQVHGHQNDAMMYVLQGAGYDLQDGERIDWAAGDLAIIHAGTVHCHACTSAEPARVLIVKAKPLYLFLNLLFQGLVAPASKEPLPGWEGYRPEP